MSLRENHSVLGSLNSAVFNVNLPQLPSLIAVPDNALNTKNDQNKSSDMTLD